MTEPSKQQVWFLDTSFLFSVSVDEDLFTDIRLVLEPKPIIYLSIVAGELQAPGIGGWSGMTGTVSEAYDWLPDPKEITHPKILQNALEIQLEVANGRPLEWLGQHLAESTMIAVAETAERSTPIMLSDDYDARVAAVNHGVKAMSLHRLLNIMISRGLITSERAFAHSEAVRLANRGPDVTEEELRTGKGMGRAGFP